MIDYTAWLHGAYILNAVQSALNPKKVKYPKSPINVKEKETPLSETEKFKLWVMEFNKRFEKNSNQCPNV
uniref:hypothetical protein n=1 Tax=Diplocloster agilis TaxID=2850323 RepID=UPI001D3B6420|nr:hypothetical protein [Diplocloster agilis]MBU9745736.1 hypothetical protein [Diplocloster agilis]